MFVFLHGNLRCFSWEFKGPTQFPMPPWQNSYHEIPRFSHKEVPPERSSTRSTAVIHTTHQLLQKTLRRFGLMVFLSLNIPDFEGEMMILGKSIQLVGNLEDHPT